MPAAHAPVPPAPARAPAHLERGIVRSINSARRRYGLVRLRPSPRLTFVAGLHSLDLARTRSVSHSSSDGTSWARRVRAASKARLIGETIAVFRGRPTSRAVVRAWLASPAHRTELLAPGFRRIGVGVVRRGRTSIVTADFASGR